MCFSFSVFFVCVLCCLAHCWGLNLFQACGFTCYFFALVQMSVWVCGHVAVCRSTRPCHSVYPCCVCASGGVWKECYMKSEVVEPSAEASEFICIHSTACLSSEPILITSSSGLLRHCAYSLWKNGLLVVHSCSFDTTLSLACQESLHVGLFAVKPRHFLLF